jgi:hypothetical protein
MMSLEDKNTVHTLSLGKILKAFSLSIARSSVALKATSLQAGGGSCCAAPWVVRAEQNLRHRYRQFQNAEV